jgi:hypothetical protein
VEKGAWKPFPFLDFFWKNYESFLSMAKKTIYFGRFISTPTPTELLIRSGAVLVAGEDGSGVIEEVDWEAKDLEEAKSKFGMVDVVTTGNDDGFFFPGFIGTAHLSGACVVVEITPKGS